MPPPSPSVPTNRVFVVQFRTPPTGASPSYEGGVEHVASDQGTSFHSLEELSAFMVSVLTDVPAP